MTLVSRIRALRQMREGFQLCYNRRWRVGYEEPLVILWCVMPSCLSLSIHTPMLYNVQLRLERCCNGGCHARTL